MRYWKNPDEEAERTVWYAKQDHFRYPDDLPFPRRMRYGPHTPEVASRYLDADYPLPGSFPPPQPKTDGNAAWYDFLKTKVVYPGAKLSSQQAAERKQLVEEFAATGYTDMELAGYLHGFDRETGYSPIFQFQYHVLNFSKYGSVMFFKLNGITHTLHWHKDWQIDQKSISQYWDEAENDFYLFKLVGYCLFNKKFGYPVIEILHIHPGNPESILAHIPVGPVSDTTLSLFVRRNPDPDQEERWAEELKQLEDEFFNQTRWVRQNDLKRINALRQKFGLPPVDENLKPLVKEQSIHLEVERPVAIKIQADPHQEARALYDLYLQKERELDPHRRYCQRIIRETAPHNGQTPILPLATMGTDGGPLLCDYCEKQIPLEGGRYHGVGAADAWERGARGYSFILGGVTFMQETNGTLRVYHAYGPPCQPAAEKREELKRRDAGSKGSWNYSTQEKMRSFIQTLPDAEPGLLNRIRLSLYGYDPGVGITPSLNRRSPEWLRATFCGFGLQCRASPE